MLAGLFWKTRNPKKSIFLNTETKSKGIDATISIVATDDMRCAEQRSNVDI